MADVKLFRPQRLTDNDDGGGLATATEVVDGQVNNLFDDISRIDRVNGEVSLRKTFVIASTENTDVYSGVHLIVQAPPLDPRVSMLLFKSTAWNDQRADAQASIERFLDESVLSRMIPFDRQLQGARAVQVFQRPELPLPEIGEVYALKVESTGKVEFIRVQDIDHQVETFTDDKGDYSVRVIAITTSQPLENEFAGSQPSRYFTVATNAAVMRKTLANDAARYKGAAFLAEDAAPGDLTIKVESVFAQLVPSAVMEIPVVDALPPGGVLSIATSNVSLLDPSFNWSTGTGTGNLMSSPVPGTFRVVNGNFAWVVEDVGGGVLKSTSGQYLNEQVGTINYSAGSFAWTKAFSATGFGSAGNYQPAVVVSQSALTHAIPINIGNRGSVYVVTLRPPPAPGSTVFNYHAQGRWYELQDDGTGALRGDGGVGVGSINFATGTTTVTLGAQPDVGSSLLYAWGAGNQYEIREDDVDIAVPAVKFQLEAGNCEPETLTVEWLGGGVLRTASADAAGTFSGDATGRVNHATGDVVLRPERLPDPATAYTCDYVAGAIEEELFTPSAVAGSITLNGSSAPWRPGSVRIDYLGTGPVLGGQVSQYARSLTDDGAGHLLDDQGATIPGSTVNYSTGQVSFMPAFTAAVGQLQRAAFAAPIPSRLVDAGTGSFLTAANTSRWPQSTNTTPSTVYFINGQPVTLRYKLDATVDDTVVDEAHPAQPLYVDLTPYVSSVVVPGGLIFALGGRTYYDRDGALYYGFNMSTGAGTAAGSIDYNTGLVTLTSWVGGGIAPAFDIKALLTQVAAVPMAYVHGRTPGSPIRPGSYSIRALRYSDGAEIIAVAGNDGNFDTADMHGHVDATTGVFAVAFGRYVLDSSLSGDDKSEDWYDAANVDGDGYIWRPAEAMPGSVRFSCVVQAPQSLDRDIVKINPVRLPSDGRVPIFRGADTLVLSDPLPFTLPDELEAAQVVALPRSPVDSVALYDQDGLGVDPALYAVDLAEGEVTMADPLDLSAYREPLVAIHAVEDMAQCLDVQITGEITLGAPLTHAYTAGQSLCSSALVINDVQARYEHLFAQNTWLNEWEDELVGTPPTSGAQYNDALYPVQVLNADAITQRWAIRFTSSTAFNIVGETMGVIGTGTTSTGASPDNPATGEPYFIMPAAGFGGGWANGNVIRFNTIAAGAPAWVARTVQSGPATEQDDRGRLQIRWDKD